MNTCPYCQQDLDEAICSHWVTTLSDDSEGDDTPTPLYFAWRQHHSQNQDKMVASFDRYFMALCALCDQAAGKGPHEIERILEEAKGLPAHEEATLKEAVELRARPDLEGDYETVEDLLQSEFGQQMKSLFAALFGYCEGEISETDYTIDHSPGLSWSGTHYCAEDAQKCVLSIMQECEEATGRIRKLIHTR